MSQSPHWLIIGAKQDPRVQGFQQALHRAGYATANVLDYHQHDPLQLGKDFTPHTYLRIESPSHDLTVVRKLMKQGQERAEQAGFHVCSDQELDQAQLDKGQFIAPHQFYFGLKQHLAPISQQLRDTPVAASMNHIPDIVHFFDKQQCHQQLSQQHISVPRALYDIGSYQELRDRMQQQRLHQVFIKTRFGSGASGIIALRTQPSRIHAQTTLTQQHGALYNTRRLVTIHDEPTLARLVDQLCLWGVQCEAWVPKASINQRSSDCRLLLVNQALHFAVLRQSRTPITNLHLLNQRSTIQALTQRMQPTDWQAVTETAYKIAKCFPKSFHIAIDLAVHRDLQQHSVLEINAFGDFLQNIHHNNMNSYDWEIQQFMHRYSESHS